MVSSSPAESRQPGHCVGSSALATVIEALFGTPDVPEIVMTSPTAPRVTHRFTSMRAYTDEASQARIWAGFHYRFSTVVGQAMGRKLGRYVVENVMQPVAIAEARGRGRRPGIGALGRSDPRFVPLPLAVIAVRPRW